MFKDKKKMWILILALVFVVCAGAFIALKLFAPEGSVARISVDGELLQTVDLSRVTEAYDIDIDTVYGHKKPELGQNTQCLHAKELTFRHPRTDEPVTVTCPLPEEFARVLQVLEHKK